MSTLYTFFDTVIYNPPIELKVYTFWGLLSSATKSQVTSVSPWGSQINTQEWDLRRVAGFVDC